MEEYRVELEGHATVEAQNREEAEEKAEDLAFRRPDDIEITGGTAHPLSSDEQYFFCDIREVGHSFSSAGYKNIEGKSAANVAFRSATSICRSLVGSEDAPALRYELALFLLSTLEGDSTDGKKVEENVQEIKEKAHQLSEEEFETSPHAEVAKQSFVLEEG